MTWNPLKKNYLSLRPTPAYPCLTSAEDRELDIAVQRLSHVEDTLRKMIKEMKKYIETIINLDKADQKLTTNLSSCSLVHINDEFRKIVENYHSVTNEVGLTVQDTVTLLNKTFVEPLKKLRNEFYFIREALNKREELVNNWKTAFTNLKKYQDRKEKTGSNIAKLEREKKLVEQTAKDLKLKHSQLLSELPSFLEKRLNYLNPTLHALIVIQLKYYANCTKLFTQLMPTSYNRSSESPSSTMITEEEYNQSLNSNFSRIRNLTIIKND